MAKEVLEMEVKSNIGQVEKDTEGLAKATKTATQDVKKLSVSFGSLLKATGFIALLSKAFEVLKETFGKNQKVVDFFSTSMTTLSIAFNDLFSYIDKNYVVIKGYLKGIFTDPLGEMAKLGLGIEKFFIEKMKGAALVLKGVATIMTNLSNPKKMLEGLAQISAGTVIAGKEIAAIYTDIESAVSDYIDKTLTQAKGLTEAEKLARLAQITFAKLNAESLRAAELQRQIRDDVSKTFAERIAANEKLSEILKKQTVDQEAALQIQLDAATKAWSINKENIDLILAKGEAEVAMAELLETISGQESEQLTNKIALEEELRVGREQSLAEGMSAHKRELEELENAYNEKKRLAIKSGVETTDITKQYEKQKSDLVRENVNVQLEAFSGLAGALSSLAGDNKELAVASAVIDTYVGANKAFAQGGTLGFVTGAAVIAQGLNNVRTIMATDVPSSGGSSGGGSAPSTPAPQMMSGAFDISGGVAPEATKAYVVTDEMSNSQNQLANIRRRATI